LSKIDFKHKTTYGEFTQRCSQLETQLKAPGSHLKLIIPAGNKRNPQVLVEAKPEKKKKKKKKKRGSKPSKLASS
jgi:hypothetical protein